MKKALYLYEIDKKFIITQKKKEKERKQKQAKKKNALLHSNEKFKNCF